MTSQSREMGKVEDVSLVPAYFHHIRDGTACRQLAWLWSARALMTRHSATQSWLQSATLLASSISNARSRAMRLRTVTKANYVKLRLGGACACLGPLPGHRPGKNKAGTAARKASEYIPNLTVGTQTAMIWINASGRPSAQCCQAGGYEPAG